MVQQASRNEDSDHADRTAVDEEDSPLDFKQTAAIWYTLLFARDRYAEAIAQLTVTLNAGSPS